ncbi:hypothetical protein V8F06_011883 [Rhypophila decipiens]
MGSTSNPSPLILEPEGDLTLRGRPTDGRSWQVALPEDDADAAETILQVVHAPFDKPPNECRSSDATVDKLYAILVFVDKYDMRKVLRPWIQDMVPDVHTFQRSRNYSALITIIHELGLWEALDLLLRRLVLECSVNNESELIQPDGSPFRLSAMSLVYQQMVLGELPLTCGYCVFNIFHGDNWLTCIDNIVGIREHFVESAFKLIREDIYLKDNVTDDFRVAFPEADRAITSAQDSQALGSQYQGSVDQILRRLENAAVNFCTPSEFHLLGPCLRIILRRLEDQIHDHEINLSKVQEEYLEWRREEVGVEWVPGCEGARRTVPQLHADCGCLEITFNTNTY